MPIKKGKDCFGDVMHEWKHGQLHSGKKGPVVKSQKQAKAIATSMCYDEGCGGGCGCRSCDRAQKRKANYVEYGFSEEASDELVFGSMAAPLGYPTPDPGILNFEKKKGLWDNIHAKRKRMKRKGNKERKARKGDKNYPDTLNIDHAEQSDDTEMAMSRVDVMRGRLEEIATKMMQIRDMGGKISLPGWMRDKLTLAADYLSAVGDNAVHGGGLEVEFEISPTVNMYKENGNKKDHQKSSKTS